MLITLALALGGGLAGFASGIPAGALVGSMAAVGGYNLATDGRARLPAGVRDASRILVGTVIGSLVTPSVLAALGANLGWAVLLAVATIGAGVGCAFALARATDLDLGTALLALSPGGIGEMTALAHELGRRVDIVVGIHLVRKVLAVAAIAGTVWVLELM